MKTLHSNRRLRRAGFSLAVIVIFGPTAVVPKLMDRLADAKWGKVKSDIAAIDSALMQFAINNGGQYPDTLESLVTPDVNNRTYLDRTTVPRDPWGSDYAYEPPSGLEEHRVICYGADKQPGGEGDDRDVDNIMLNQEF